MRLLRSSGQSFGFSVAGCEKYDELAIGQQGIVVTTVREGTLAASKPLLR